MKKNKIIELGNFKLFLLLPLIGLLFSVLVDSSLAEGGDSFKIGDKAPNFELTSTNDRTYNLEKLKGSIVVLEWFNQRCPFVKKHYLSSSTQMIQKKYVAKGVVWLNIISSGPGRSGFGDNEWHNQTREDWEIESTATLIDSDGKIGHLYGAKTTPHYFIIDKDGKLAYRGAIDSIRSTEIADIATSKNYVGQALNELLKGEKVSEADTVPYGCSVKYLKK